EIEAVLSAEAEVRECVVLAREDVPENVRLVAYLVAAKRDEEAMPVTEMRARLGERLPEYMIPSAFVWIEEMPLTPNGKVDRKALLAIKVEGGARASEYEGARNEVEELLARVWQEALGLERVGIHDNFFELGGDSILSIQIVGKAKRAGLSLQVQQIFQYQTIAELARVIVSSTRQAETQQDEADGAVLLTPIQRRFFAFGLPNPHHFNQSVMLEVGAPLSFDTLQSVINQLVAQHDALRLRFTEAEAGWQQAYTAAEQQQLSSRVELAHLTDETEQRRQLEAHAAATQASLNLSAGPLLRVVLFDLGAGRAARLLLVMHHLVIDGVSWRILLEDLQTAFAQVRNGQSIELPARTSSFKRWSESLRQY